LCCIESNVAKAHNHEKKMLNMHKDDQLFVGLNAIHFWVKMRCLGKKKGLKPIWQGPYKFLGDKDDEGM
jgi:hypothetical protein